MKAGPKPANRGILFEPHVQVTARNGVWCVGGGDSDMDSEVPNLAILTMTLGLVFIVAWNLKRIRHPMTKARNLTKKQMPQQTSTTTVTKMKMLVIMLMDLIWMTMNIWILTLNQKMSGVPHSQESQSMFITTSAPVGRSVQIHLA